MASSTPKINVQVWEQAQGISQSSLMRHLKNLTPSAINKYREINQRQSAKRFNDERHQG
jgi:hypothetical protein